MKYILTLWLLWAEEDLTQIQVSPFVSLETCIKYARNFSREVRLDGVTMSVWYCDPFEEDEEYV